MIRRSVARRRRCRSSGRRGQPALIQHGELDRRVPIANAYELRQRLEDRGVKAGMIVYKGRPHGITKPKPARAVIERNPAWPDFTAAEVPRNEEKK